MNDENVMERKADYFLRYLADVPADEIEMHKVFSTQCRCAPAWVFEPKNGWHHLTHQRLKNMEF